MQATHMLRAKIDRDLLEFILASEGHQRFVESLKEALDQSKKQSDVIRTTLLQVLETKLSTDKVRDVEQAFEVCYERLHQLGAGFDVLDLCTEALGQAAFNEDLWRARFSQHLAEITGSLTEDEAARVRTQFVVPVRRAH